MTADDVRLELDRLIDRVDDLVEEVAKLRRSEEFRIRVDALGVPIQEAARLAGIGVNEFRELVRSGRISSVPVGDTGYRRVIPVAAIADFLERAAEGGEATS